MFDGMFTYMGLITARCVLELVCVVHAQLGIQDIVFHVNGNKHVLEFAPCLAFHEVKQAFATDANLQICCVASFEYLVAKQYKVLRTKCLLTVILVAL